MWRRVSSSLPAARKASYVKQLATLTRPQGRTKHNRTDDLGTTESRIPIRTVGNHFALDHTYAQEGRVRTAFSHHPNYKF